MLFYDYIKKKYQKYIAKLNHIEKQLFFSELKKLHYKKIQSKGFKSQLADISIINEILEIQARNPDYILFYNPCLIPDNKIPQSYKNLGVKIEVQNQYISINFNKNDDMVITDDKGDDITLEKIVYGSYLKNKVTIYNNIFILENKYGNIFNNLINGKKNNDFYNLSDIMQSKLIYLVENLGNKFNLDALENTLFHEMKHAKNDYYKIARDSKPQANKLSPENFYRLLEDDEKSANLEAIFYDINCYLKKEKNLSCLHQYHWIFSNIIKNTVEKKQTIKDYLTDSKQITIDTIKHWEENQKDWYTFNDFYPNMRYYSLEVPISLIDTSDSDDNNLNNKEYLLRRKLMYTFERFNPDTGNMISVDVSPFVPHVEISQEEQENIIDPFMLTIYQRKAAISPYLAKLIETVRDDIYSEKITKNTNLSQLNHYMPNNQKTI